MIEPIQEKEKEKAIDPPIIKKERKKIKPPTPRKQTIEEKKDRLLKELSRKRVTQATEVVENIKKLHEETNGCEKELKKKESELRKGIKLIRQTRILRESGDLNKENIDIEQVDKVEINNEVDEE